MNGGARRPVWMDRPTIPEQAIKAITLVVISLLIILPFLTVISTSLASQKEITDAGGYLLVPLHPTLRAYQLILEGGVVTRAVIISVGVTVVGTLLSLAVTTAMAYALSRPGVVFAKQALLIALFTLLFTPGIIPVYLVVQQLGLIGNYASLILPVLVSAFNLIVMRNFFMNIPQELIDSARIDGAGDFTILRLITLPLSRAVLAVIGLFYAVSYWNAFFNALLYLNDSSMWPLQLVLRLYVLQGGQLPGSTYAVEGGAPPPSDAIQMAVVVIATVPILIVYPFLQRYFTRGVLTGAIKG